MRLEDITDVFCLSCVLLVFSVKAQPGCPTDWFGSGCKYKCRCENNACDTSGQCTGTSKCKNGWFGPACQYVDLAYNTENDPAAVDNDDTTCFAKFGVTQAQFTVPEPFFFTWLRVVVHEDESSSLNDLTVSFALKSVPVVCNVMKKQEVDSSTMDIHCNLQQMVDDIILEGSSANYLCSVYISGGRNVALKEMTFQDTIYSHMRNNVKVSFTSDKAVDGNTERDFPNGLSCSSTNNQVASQFPVPTWMLKLSKPREINRYLIHNIQNKGSYLMSQLMGFRLESFDSKNASLFVFKDVKPDAQEFYKIFHATLPVQAVIITAKNRNSTLALCEVEVYGESICDNQHYGRECELTCPMCPYNQPCFVATGGCPVGCPPGLFGPGCSNKCTVGKFGTGCNASCSPNCERVGTAVFIQCHHVDGTCTHGCKVGYAGPSCEQVCGVGYFGKNCKSKCSQNCMESKDVKISPCHRETGSCIRGCKAGFIGDTCNSECSVGMYGDGCNLTCSVNCVESRQANISKCDISTGACLIGCKSGFYGETCKDECSFGKYGKNCSSLCSQACIVDLVNLNISPCKKETGACIRGCIKGFTGVNCVTRTVCDVGKYGVDCNLPCSQSCKASGNATISSCNGQTGACNKGCKPGFTGANCDGVCVVGNFGENCSLSCSPNCVNSSDANKSPCHHETGACIGGCRSGFTGLTCDNAKAVGDILGGTGTEIVVGFCLTTAALLFLGYLFCKKKKVDHQKEEKTPASVKQAVVVTARQ